MDSESPLANIKTLVQEAEKHLESKDWPYLAHVLTDLAMESMVLAEKAQSGGADLDPDYDPSGGV